MGHTCSRNKLQPYVVCVWLRCCFALAPEGLQPIQLPEENASLLLSPIDWWLFKKRAIIHQRATLPTDSPGFQCRLSNDCGYVTRRRPDACWRYESRHDGTVLAGARGKQAAAQLHALPSAVLGEVRERGDWSRQPHLERERVQGGFSGLPRHPPR